MWRLGDLRPSELATLRMGPFEVRIRGHVRVFLREPTRTCITAVEVVPDRDAPAYALSLSVLGRAVGYVTTQGPRTITFNPPVTMVRLEQLRVGLAVQWEWGGKP